MFSSRVLFLFVSAAFAAPGGGEHGYTRTITVTASVPVPTHISQCNTGGAACCNTVQSSDEENTPGLLGILGIAVQGNNRQVGLGCSPMDGQGANCAQQPVCCENNQFNGLINFGCSPVRL